MLLAFVLMINLGYAQKMKQWIKMADAAVAENDWPTAVAAYEGALELDSTLIELRYGYGEALYKTKDFGAALYQLDYVFTKDKGRLFPDTQFWLAMCQKAEGDYSQALRNFKKYNKKIKRQPDSYKFKKSAIEIEACTWALNERKDDSALIINQLKNNVNSTETEISPYWQDSILYFATLAEGDRLLSYYAPFDSLAGEKSPVQLGLDAHHQANITFSPDGNRVFCSLCDEKDRCDLYVGEIENGEWYGFEKLPHVNKTGYTSTMPYFCEINGIGTLFYVSDRPGGEGGLDIWWSEFDDEEPTPPINAGFQVNSPDNEITPFYLDGHLYFSSDWHIGFGGFDIFKSAGRPRHFAEPINLQYPINSAANELYYTYNLAGERGFMASNRLGSYVLEGERCCNDIYTFQYRDSLVAEEERIANLEALNKYLPVTLYFHNDEPVPDSWDTTTTLSYMDAYNSYVALKPRYSTENARGLEAEEKESAELDVADWYEFYVDKGVNDLKLFTRLLKEELEKGTQVDLTIRGFASPRAESDYNVNLTKRRTSSLINFLREYEDGILIQYMVDSLGTGALTFVEIPYGEFEAAEGVNDQLNNEKESIYSRAARLERKIMIESVQRAAPDAPVIWNEDYHDFGVIPSRGEVEHTFRYTNSTADTMRIDSVLTECGCTVPSLSSFDLAPLETATMVVSFNPEGKRGPVTKMVAIYFEGIEEPKIITIEADVR